VKGGKAHLLPIANRLAITGTVFLAAAIVLALYVITDVLFATWFALVTAVLALVLFGWFWYALPLLGRFSADTKADDQDSRGAADRSV